LLAISLVNDFEPDFDVGEAEAAVVAFVDVLVAVPVAVLEEVELEEAAAGASTVSKVKEADIPVAFVHAEGVDATIPATKLTAAHYLGLLQHTWAENNTRMEQDLTW
jgi:hypothetical protein